jgi:hypothetical protein
LGEVLEVRIVPSPLPFLCSALLLAFSGCAQLPSPLDFGQGRTSRQVLTVAPGEEVLRVTLPARGGRPARHAMMKRLGVNGTIETWMSQDWRSISLDRGVVVGTRGFGFDLMGADASPALAAMAAPSGAAYSRLMRYLTADNHSVWLRAGCHLATVGHDAARGLRQIEEHCEAATTSFTNRYWLDAAGQILRSTQWIASEIGYFELDATRQPSDGALPRRSSRIVRELIAPR